MDINQYKDNIIQISTPTGTGSGFYLQNQRLIITNSHVVDGNREVVIKAYQFEKQIADVVFDDPRHDIAFIKAPIFSVERPLIISAEDVKDGDKVFAIGHPYGLNYTTTEGIVSKAKRIQNDIEYIQTDAAINPGNSGGPLLNEKGEVVGINTLVIQESNNLGFSLATRYVTESLENFDKFSQKSVIRCNSCQSFILEDEIEDDYCPNCGKKIEVAKQRREGYKPTEPTVILIEEIINSLGKDIKTSRVGQRSWEIEEGSATIKINYYNTGIIICDSYLCRLPSQNLKEMYEFLLRENDKLDYLFFSLTNNKIVLSFLVNNSSLTLDYGKEAINRLFKKSDFYDDYLINNYGAVKINKDE